MKNGGMENEQNMWREVKMIEESFGMAKKLDNKDSKQEGEVFLRRTMFNSGQEEKLNDNYDALGSCFEENYVQQWTGGNAEQ